MGEAGRKRLDPCGLVNAMGDLSDLAKSPEHRRGFERLLFLAAKRGDADLVAERLGWGVDPRTVNVGSGVATAAGQHGATQVTDD